MVGKYTYTRISEDAYRKAVGTLRLQLNGVFKPFDIYGMGEFIPGAIDECVHLAEQFAMRVRGADRPIKMRDTYRSDV